MHALRRGHATPRGVKCCAPGAGGLPANYLLNLVLNLALNALDLGKLVFRRSPFDSCCNQLYKHRKFAQNAQTKRPEMPLAFSLITEPITFP